jgi:ribosomal-protein-alanine N-acetyltransferase
VKASDLDALWAYLNDPLISEFTTWEYHQTKAETETYLHQVLNRYQNGHVENWGIELKSVGSLIGMIGFGYLNEHHLHGEVGYVLARSQWGKGITSKALQMVVQQGIHEMGLEKIMGRCIAENIGSRRVLEKTGFQSEGYLRNQFRKRNVFRDIAVYGLLREGHQTRTSTAADAPAV